ncbi:DNA-binding protein [Acinetobacter sp. MD2(2019)]|uniref:DNA-binding protein n=1 Tax=Acinetobacter sp. MD2(2019) TaxID=2605273 RepID=UPI002D1EEF88|nr:DNA-binding protein [Acinetobacter sp. MD2(2019)]MEB3753820.1 DNA-binding protein [Acinetobacter sp. MD2(2019)]
MELPTKPKKGRATHAKVQYNLRIDPDLLNWLKDLGCEYERPVNYLINHAVKQMKEAIESAKA